ncbi:MAG: sigma-70 family RNA polymerase sigma factor [Actinomycetota bacterium]|jgi:RNA polymerase sigma factor (sigma-70 family)|nr:sigma-70 family RNA polymerase sigma factor [Actinomycetota bacterium]
MSQALVLAVGDEQLGVEAAAEGFSRAFERWDSVSRYGNPRGWVYRVGLNWARSWLRRRKTERARQERLRAGSVDRLPDPDLERALATLTPAQRDVVIMRFFLDLSVIETADSLGVAPGTVKSRLSRALAHLNHQLTDSSEEVDLR